MDAAGPHGPQDQRPEGDLDNLADAYARRAIRLTQLERATATIEARLAEIGEQLAGTAERAERAARYTPTSRVKWDDATIEQRRVLLDDLLPVVRIFPAGSNLPPPVPVYVHVYDWRGRLLPLPIGPEEAAIYEQQVAHAKRYGGIID